MNKNKTTKPNANAVGAESISARRINNDKPIANTVGADDPVRPQTNAGITLIALIITIIIMLLLVGVSVIIAINGGLFGTAKNAAKGTEKAKNAEQQLANGRIQIDGTWYDSFEDYLIGKASENQQIGDLNESNTTFIYEPAGWTNGEVKVKIEVAAVPEGYTLQYRVDGSNNWYGYTTETEIKMSVNGAAIYARLLDSEENPGDVATGNVANIDRLAPTVALEPNGGTNYAMPSTGNAKISTKITVADQKATKTDGCSGLDVLQYAWSTSSTTEPSDWTTFTNGDTVTKSDITSAGTWYLWTKVTDKAGNRSEEIKVSNAFTISGAGAEENKITLTPSTNNWTNKDVTVTASYGANLIGTKTLTCTGTENEDYIVNGTESVVVKTNGITVTAKVKDLAGNEVVEEFKVEKIDKAPPTIVSGFSAGGIERNEFNAWCVTMDSDSGYSRAELYYKTKSEDKFILGPDPTPNNTTITGNTEFVQHLFYLSGLTSSTTYEVYALIYDMAGNVTRTPEEGTIDVTTKGPTLLGKTATIDGRKFIVMYDAGEKITIEGATYELPYTQLISEDVLLPAAVTIGYNDTTWDWTSSSMIANADLNKSGTLDKTEIAIYTYNHATSILNSHCFRAITQSNTFSDDFIDDIMTIRSVGSNPYNRFLDNGAMFTASDLTGPNSNNGKYQGKVKTGINSSATDLQRLTDLGILTTPSKNAYWVADRRVRDTSGRYPSYHWCEILTITGSGATSWVKITDFGYYDTAYSPLSGIRPIVSISPENLTKYLDAD